MSRGDQYTYRNNEISDITVSGDRVSFVVRVNVSNSATGESWIDYHRYELELSNGQLQLVVRYVL